MRHANAREVRWTVSSIRELAASHETEVRRELLQYVAPSDLERAITAFLDIRLIDYLYELTTGIGLWTREQTINVVAAIVRGQVPAPPPLELSSERALFLAQAILSGKFKCGGLALGNHKSQIASNL